MTKLEDLKAARDAAEAAYDAARAAYAASAVAYAAAEDAYADAAWGVYEAELKKQEETCDG
jgi:hypothetical protein